MRESTRMSPGHGNKKPPAPHAVENTLSAKRDVRSAPEEKTTVQRKEVESNKADKKRIFLFLYDQGVSITPQKQQNAQLF